MSKYKVGDYVLIDKGTIYVDKIISVIAPLQYQVTDKPVKCTPPAKYSEKAHHKVRRLDIVEDFEIIKKL